MKKRFVALATSGAVLAALLAINNVTYAQTSATNTSSMYTSPSSAAANTNTTGSSGLTGSTSINGSTTPGLPNTGAGGNAFATEMGILVAGLVAIGGSLYLARQYVA